MINATSESEKNRTLVASFLVFNGIDNIIRILDTLPQWLTEFSYNSNFISKIVIRINNPLLDICPLQSRVLELQRVFCRKHHPIEIIIVDLGCNVGFGRGHNEAYKSFRPDFFVIMNDDIGFPDITWLPRAISKFDIDDNLALVGETANPQAISPFFGNGTFPSEQREHSLRYAEASVLIVRGSAFESVGMFDETFEWAMCEDADLSFKIQQRGYRIDWIPMPHEHWRSTSFNALPSYARYSILEHNRARLFAKWGQSLAAGVVGKVDVFDLYSDGIGDVFCSLFHLAAEYRRLPASMHGNIVVNTNYVDLARLLLPESARLETESALEVLAERYRSLGIANIRSIRRLIYSLPFNIHTLLSSTLSLPLADQGCVDSVFREFRSRLTSDELFSELGTYCVVHLESNRVDHDGRMPSPRVREQMLSTITEKFEKVVIVGLEKQLSFTFLGRNADKVVDLQGALSLKTLISVVLSANAFVGIDSFPAHIAQMAKIPAAIFFGSINPLTRIWSETVTWPIAADLECIGCYHDHVETSVPFCMRRDSACTKHIESHLIERAISDLIAGRSFDWDKMRRRLALHQSKFIHLLQFHPAPPTHFVKPRLPNENISRLVYEITDKIISIYGDQTRNKVVDGLKARNTALYQELSGKDRALEAAQKKLRATDVSTEDQHVTVDLIQIVKRYRQCSWKADGDWTCIMSSDVDPQLVLQPIAARSELHVSVAAVANRRTSMKLYWRYDRSRFSEDRVHCVQIGPEPRLLLWDHVIESNRQLYLRLDPAETACEIRIKAKVMGNIFVLSTAESAKPIVLHRVASKILSAIGHNKNGSS
jgi:hypothetical protein